MQAKRLLTIKKNYDEASSILFGKIEDLVDACLAVSNDLTVEQEKACYASLCTLIDGTIESLVGIKENIENEFKLCEETPAIQNDDSLLSESDTDLKYVYDSKTGEKRYIVE